MLDRVDLGGVHNGFLVGAGHADVEGGDGGLACQVFPGYIDAGLEQDVVYGKACDFFHGKSPFLVCNYSEPARFRFAASRCGFSPYRFPAKSVRSCKHDSHFRPEIYLSLNSYILSKNIAADNLDFTYGRC